MKGSAIIIRMGLCAAVVCLMALAVASKPPRYPLRIEVLGSEIANPLIVPQSGWALSIAIKAEIEPLGIVRRTTPPVFPQLANLPGEPLVTRGGFMIFDDRDGCLSMVNPDCLIPNDPQKPACATDYYINPACKAGVNETLLEFIPGQNPPEAVAVTGFSERLPGLVILSDTGMGNGYRTDGSLASPRVAFNLAANVGSLGYLLRDSKAQPVLVATITAPYHMIDAKVEVDRHVGPKNECQPARTITARYRIDGGPIVTRDFPPDGLNMLDALLFAEKVANFRIFIVRAMNGPAVPESLQPPLYIVDMDRDGVVTARDAARMGYDVLSDEKVVQYRVYYNIDFQGEPKDFDGNECEGAIVAPGSPGGITRVPS